MEEFTKVQFSNLDKILYPESKVTKSDVIRYYIKMAPRMLGILKDRPLVLTRFPNGVAEKGFYEKERPADTPSWVKTFTRYSDSAKREIDYVVCNNLDTLVWLANLAALELHMTLSKIDDFKTRALLKTRKRQEKPNLKKTYVQNGKRTNLSVMILRKREIT